MRGLTMAMTLQNVVRGAPGFFRRINPFAGDMIPALGANAVTFTATSVVDGVGAVSMAEQSGGYEGVNIELSGLIPGKQHLLTFRLQHLTGGYWARFYDTRYQWNIWQESFTYGYMVTDEMRSDYQNDFKDWPDNLIRDMAEHPYACLFTPSGTTAYLSFNFSALADEANTLQLDALTCYVK